MNAICGANQGGVHEIDGKLCGLLSLVTGIFLFVTTGGPGIKSLKFLKFPSQTLEINNKKIYICLFSQDFFYIDPPSSISWVRPRLSPNPNRAINKDGI